MVNGADNNLYFGLNVSPDNQLREIPEVESFGDNYFTLAPFIGYEWRLSHFLGDGSLLAEAGYSLISGDEGNMGSSRHHGEFKIGWKQRFPIKSLNLYVMPQVGTGMGGDKLNFGSGKFPEWKFGASLQAQGMAGLEYCFTPQFCTATGVGYFYERNIAGVDYHNRGMLAGVSFSLTFAQPEPEIRVETKIVERIVYRDKIIIKEKPAALTLEGIARAIVSDDESFGLPYFFKKESAALRLSEGEEPNLTILLLALKAHPEVRLLLRGHTDDAGEQNYNNWLSLQRAREVQKYLVQAGVPMERIVVDGEDLSILKCNNSDGVYLYYTHPDSLDYSSELLPERAKPVRVARLDEIMLCPDHTKRIWIRNARGASVLGSSKPLANIADPEMRKAMEKRVEFVRLK